ITGASQGIGRATAIAFAEAGCRLHLTARDARALDDVRTCALERRQVAIETHPMDLTQPGAVAAIAARCGDIDILVNNAGVIPSGPLDSLDEAQWRNGWELKVFGYINMTRVFLPGMKARGTGVIINDIGNS